MPLHKEKQSTANLNKPKVKPMIGDARNWQRCACLSAQHVPYVVLISEHDDGPGIGGLQQAPDDLVKLPRLGLPRDLQRLGNTHTTWKRDTDGEDIPLSVFFMQLFSFFV